MAGCGLKLPNYEDLSTEQDAVLNLPLGESHVVTGPPGSGKTVMAIYRAGQLHKKFGERTILIMYNKLLSTYTTAAVGLGGIDAVAKTFHSWFGAFYRKQYGHRAPQRAPYEFDWQAIFEEIGVSGLPERERSHIIVDEGQDLPTEFYTVLTLISNSMTIFADENQKLNNQTNSSISQIKAVTQVGEEHTLSKNYRNSLPIARVAGKFHVGIKTGITDLPPAERPGDLPMLVRDRGFDETMDRLIRWELSHPSECIGVFLPRTPLQKRVYDALNGKTKNKAQIYSSSKSVMEGRRTIDFSKPGLKIINYASSKGLEFDTVFLPLLEKNRIPTDDPMFSSKFYVMSSRARRSLIFHYSGDEPTVIKALPLDMIEDQR